ncbi:MAG: response regulator transcription factor [Maledivibacter sp.]|jgi:DNA-binding response OmpR family regulator|nr:response regulator transcription factor [Maledivibacter sp.]
MINILIVEDEEAISEFIKLNLSMVGYNTYQAFDGKEAVHILGRNHIDLVLLDIMLPELDGYELLPRIIKKDIPVILVTAKDGLEDRVMGLNLGADDYITKPFEGIELLARINALLRRIGKQANKRSFDDVEVFMDQRKVLKSGNEIDLTFKEFDLLTVLLEHKGLALSREKLLQLVWDYDFEGSTRTVDIHIQRLRSKLCTERIKTVYKVGYRLED